MAAYNFESKGLVDAILTPIAVCEAVEMNESIVVPKIFRSSNCMWDTGATNTLISQKVVDDLGLKPYGVYAWSQIIQQQRNVKRFWFI